MPSDKLPTSRFRLILDSAMRRTARRAKIQAVTLEDSIRSMYESGMSKEDILSFIFDTPTGRARFIDPIANSFGETIRQNFQQIRHNTRDSVYEQNGDAGQLYKWVTTKENNCEDCLNRQASEPRTHEEWENIGLPQTGATICGKHCGCELKPIQN